MQTKLIYMQHMQQYICDAKILEIESSGEKTFIILDQTVFYPQGGGQPYDVGDITIDSSRFVVQEVRYTDGVVKHIGYFEFGSMEVGQVVKCSVDIERRKTNTRLHSIGHILDMALKKLELDWEPIKGYHFPEGPYVEYRSEDVALDLTLLQEKIEAVCNEIVSNGASTRIEFTGDISDMTSKPMRIVYYGDFGIPCGGTHVSNLKDVGAIRIRKVKYDKGVIRVSYC